MDFETSDWNVPSDADLLTASLFGKLHVRRLEKQKKRKHKTQDVHNVNSEGSKPIIEILNKKIGSNSELERKNMKRKRKKLKKLKGRDQGDITLKKQTNKSVTDISRDESINVKNRSRNNVADSKNAQGLSSFDGSNRGSRITVENSSETGSLSKIERKKLKMQRKKFKKLINKDDYEFTSLGQNTYSVTEDISRDGTNVKISKEIEGHTSLKRKSNDINVDKKTKDGPHFSQKKARISSDAEQPTKKKGISKSRKNVRDDKSMKEKEVFQNEKLTDSLGSVGTDMGGESNKKKKRKRKCKKNKFKDYEKEEVNTKGIKQITPITSAKKLSSKAGKITIKSLSDLKEKYPKSPSPSQNVTFSSKPSTSGKKSPFNIDKLSKFLNKSSSKEETKEKIDESKAAVKKQKQSKTETPLSSASLKEKMVERLNSARFRYLNENLYTTTGSKAFQMFKKDADSFQVYHTGFQSQVQKWPVNPVDQMIDFIKSRPDYVVVADFGCGDAKIAQSVPNKVHSFDLVALNNHVTVCDMSKVPLKDCSVDIAVFCLSLMGTNLTDYLREAHRVLKQGGVLKIAEVQSRFHSVGAFAKKVEMLGFKQTNEDMGNTMFIMMDFKKSKPAASKSSAANIEIKLEPCLYKKR